MAVFRDLDRALRKPEHVTQLLLAEQGLESLPAGIGAFKRLRVLDLRNNRLRELPSELGQLVSLERLGLSRNRLSALPPEIENLRKLAQLLVGYNQITEISSELGRMQRLRVLSLAGNGLARLPDDLEWPWMEQLDIRGHRLELSEERRLKESLRSTCVIVGATGSEVRGEDDAEAPRIDDLLAGANELLQEVDGLIGLLADSAAPDNRTGEQKEKDGIYDSLTRALEHPDQVRELALSAGESMTDLRRIGELGNLRNLSITDLGLEAGLPPEFESLVGLESLHLNRCGLPLVPPVVSELRQLERLDLSGNELAELPPELAGLEKLEVLSAAANELSDLPESLSELRQLEVLSLADNRFRDLPRCAREMPITSLDISGNRLTSFPLGILRIESLVYLDLSRNQIPAVPREIGDLRNLRRLLLKDVPLTNAQIDELREILPECNIETDPTLPVE